MTLKSFIERPVLASVISIVIVIAGIIGLASLPVEQYPDIAPRRSWCVHRIRVQAPKPFRNR